MGTKPLLNYTTEVPASRSMGEVTGLLVEGGAKAITTLYDDDGWVTGFKFVMDTRLGPQQFTLPLKVDPVHRTLTRMSDNAAPGSRLRRAQYRTRAHAEQVAWRILKEWLEAQLALIRIEMATLDEVMLPYMTSADGRTVFELITERELIVPGIHKALEAGPVEGKVVQ